MEVHFKICWLLNSHRKTPACRYAPAYRHAPACHCAPVKEVLLFNAVSVFYVYRLKFMTVNFSSTVLGEERIDKPPNLALYDFLYSSATSPDKQFFWSVVFLCSRLKSGVEDTQPCKTTDINSFILFSNFKGKGEIFVEFKKDISYETGICLELQDMPSYNKTSKFMRT